MMKTRKWLIMLAVMLIICIVILGAIHQSFVASRIMETDDWFDSSLPRTKNSTLHVIHLDLKGAPPKMDYLINVLPYLTNVGVNGLLVEYEDMFPYDGELENISSKWSYSKEEVSRFLKHCTELNIEVIPLIQTFGHMEYVLKQQEFKVLREVNYDPRAICPSDDRSFKLIKEMIRQVLKLHKFSSRIHIGCDEVYNINECSRCKKKHRSAEETFFDHVRQVATYIKDSYNNTFTPLIWDDMLRSQTYDAIRKSKLRHYVDIVIWDYSPELRASIRYDIWNTYASIFKRVWIAGAFKGAEESTSILPSMKNRYANHNSWLKFIDKKASTPVVGFISAGWSRYEHFSPLCELLPASIPSLILTALKVTQTISLSEKNIKNYKDILHCRLPECNQPEVCISDIFNLSHTLNCSFPESRLVFNTWQLEQLQNRIRQMCEDLHRQHALNCSDYSVSNKLSVKASSQLFQAESFNATNKLFHDVIDALDQEMNRFFNPNTIEEWFNTHVEPFSQKLKGLKGVQDALMK